VLSRLQCTNLITELNSLWSISRGSLLLGEDQNNLYFEMYFKFNLVKSFENELSYHATVKLP